MHIKVGNRFLYRNYQDVPWDQFVCQIDILEIHLFVPLALDLVDKPMFGLEHLVYLANPQFEVPIYHKYSQLNLSITTLESNRPWPSNWSDFQKCARFIGICISHITLWYHGISLARHHKLHRWTIFPWP